MEIVINKLWNGDEINHEPIQMKLDDADNGIKLTITAPYFNDPPPTGPPGKPQWLLWEYEVVEAFFLNSITGEYLELEFGPHGQHLGLLFKKCRDVWKKNLAFDYSARIDGNTWHGSVIIPWDYLPTDVNRFNAYAIHGTSDSRVYEALYPVPKQEFTKPDYHRLEFFKPIAMKELFPSGKWEKSSDSVWNTEPVSKDS